MKTNDVFIAHPQTSEQVSALIAFMEALKIRFEVSKEEFYNSDFLAKIEESRAQAKNGQVTKVKKEDLKEFLGLL